MILSLIIPLSPTGLRFAELMPLSVFRKSTERFEKLQKIAQLIKISRVSHATVRNFALPDCIASEAGRRYIIKRQLYKALCCSSKFS